MMQQRQYNIGVRIALLAAVVTMFSASNAGAVTEQEVRAWLTDQIKAAEQWPDLENIAWTFEYRVYSFVPKNEIEALRREVRNKPDHPLRADVEAYDFVAKNGPQVSTMTLRFMGSNKWRLCTQISGTDSYQDWVMSPKWAWTMSNKVLVQIDYQNGWPEGHRIDTMVSEVKNACSELLYGSLPMGMKLKYLIRSVEILDERWTADIQYENGYTLRLSGRWDPSSSPEISLNMTQEIDNSGSVQWTSEFEGWQLDSGLGTRRCTSARRLHPDGSPMFQYSHVKAESEESEFFKQAIKMPSFDSIDVVRGKVTATSIYDYTHGNSILKNQDGTQAQLARPSGWTSDRTSGPLRMFGWLLGGGAIVLFIGSKLLHTRAQNRCS